jgi:ion channel POLLUX/CASTOR
LQIWEDILGFENAEFYIKRWPELDGMQFGDVLISFPDAVPCGVKVALKGGKILINPDDDYVLREGDEVLVIAEDDDTYAPAPRPEVNFLDTTLIRLYNICFCYASCFFHFSLIDPVSFQVNKGFLPNIPTPPKYPEKILFCGWRRDIHDMIMVLLLEFFPVLISNKFIFFGSEGQCFSVGSRSISCSSFRIMDV